MAFFLYLFLTKILVSFALIKGGFSSNLAGMEHIAKVDLIVIHTIIDSLLLLKQSGV